jgi:hypothetical protein
VHTLVYQGALWSLRRAPEECPEAVVDLWRECIDVDPAKRPCAPGLVRRLELLVTRKLSNKGSSA